MYKLIFFGAFSLVFSPSWGQHTASPTTETHAVFDQHVAKMATQVLGLGVAVRSSELGISYVGAAGYDGRAKTHQTQPDQPFRIASVTKTFVAAAILRLEEEGLLSIDDPLRQYISQAHIDLLLADGYDLEAITLKSCLNHTSGLYDYALAGTAYTRQVAAEPMHRWTRTEQIALAMEEGNPVGKPGQKFHYSDTGYVLLGETLETLTGKDLATAMREVLDFAGLGLQSTWLESLESHPLDSARTVRRYMEEHDATDWDPSLDLYGGGGLVSTTADLATFMDALFAGRVFKHPETLEKMLTRPTLKKKPKMDYRYGLIYRDFGNIDAYLHSGFWGIYMLYFPSLKTSLVINYTDSGENAPLGPIIKEVVQIKEAQAAEK